MVADALSRRYALISFATSQFLGFSHIKALYANDKDFGEIYVLCGRGGHGKFYKHDEYLFYCDRLCIPCGYMRDLLTMKFTKVV